MVVFPNAKINLGLHITEKRSDGYHNIESVFYPIPLMDVLEIKENGTSLNNFKSLGLTIPSDGGMNLTERAWELVNSHIPIPHVDLELLKNIPIGAGLGGGSADAAFCIVALNSFFKLQIPEDKLLKMAGKLGADCSFFIKNQPIYAAGTGDQFSELEFSLKGKYIVLVYPNIHVSTPTAYKHVIPIRPKYDIRAVLRLPIEQWKTKLANDFEVSVFEEYPTIKTIKESLYEQEAIYASMSGSGSSVFGIFNTEPSVKFDDSVRYWTLKL
jgi:4-diphosphocytidyl-2-C-methyl-D-erythritol kinase|tara:strand:- start:1583 stop:2392 length:810 start_codon:yes stop_codon:yes gene_type:complete